MGEDIKRVRAEMYLGKIKAIVKSRKIKLDDEKIIKDVDKKMIEVIREVIFNENREINKKDEEIKKDYDLNTMKTLVLYYTALYFDNLELLSGLLESGFYGDDEEIEYIVLYPLDKRLSSKFDTNKYVNYINNHSSIFHYFYNSLSFQDVDKASDYAAIRKFSEIINTNPDILIKIEQCDNDRHECVKNFLTKENINFIGTDILINANFDQIRMLSYDFESKEHKKRMINLVAKYKYDVDLKDWDDVFEIFSDNEIKNINKKLAKDVCNLLYRLKYSLFYNSDKRITRKVKKLYNKSII